MKRDAAWIRWGLLVAGLLLAIPGRGEAQPFSSGSTGADGPFSPTANTTLALPPSGVFNFTIINVPAGVTVTLTRNATNTPATLLAAGDVTIAGTLDLNGQPGAFGSSGTATGPNGGLPGPGGGAGGTGSTGTLTSAGGGGLGPGGGTPGSPTGGGSRPHCSGAGGGHNGPGGNGTGGQLGTCSVAGGPTYGGARLLPLLGGSGGGGGSAFFGGTAGGGGGGGGAVVIASSTRITLTGSIRANGGSGGGAGLFQNEGGGGGGSGGAIRLAAPILAGSRGSLQVGGGTGGAGNCDPNGCLALGGPGAPGRIRLEASTFSLTATMTVGPSQGPLGTVTLATPPGLRITSVAGLAAPASPQGSYGTPDLTLPAGFTNPLAITLEGSQIPPGTGVTVRSTPLQGSASTTTGSLTGSTAASTASVSLSLPTNQPTVIAAEATFALVTTASLDGPTRFAGEPISHVRVAATFGGTSTVTYITASGKEVPADRLMSAVTGQQEGR